MELLLKTHKNCKLPLVTEVDLVVIKWDSTLDFLE